MATVISSCMFGIFGLFVRYLHLPYFEMTNKYLYNKLNDKNNVLGDQGGVKSSTPIDKMESKGAIPKQPNKGKENQMSNRNDCEIPKMTDGIPVEIIVSTDVDRLKSMISHLESNVFQKKIVWTCFDRIFFPEYFSGDLSSLINFIIGSNSRPEKIVNHKKLIESVENLLQDKFKSKSVKCHLIGSHAYNIAKGGLATVDIYLDLRECYLIYSSIDLHHYLLIVILCPTICS